MKRIFLILAITVLLLGSVAPLLDSAPYEIREDENGVPLVDYGWLLGRHIGERRYPVAIAARADKYYSYYLASGNETYLKRFKGNLEWLMENRLEEEDYVLWRSDFDYPFYGCKAGWPSAMAQGFALKDLTHAYELTKDSRYLELAEGVVNSYRVEIEQGGILYIDPDDGGWWYAEYACGEPPRVLNGFWFALDGLHYYANKTGDEKAWGLYLEGVEELKEHLDDFDRGDWTYYDLEGYPADTTYHPLHVEIMLGLYNQTGDEAFLSQRQGWERYNYSKTRFNILLLRNLLIKIQKTVIR